jgi:2,3-bisphosphoglycerate-dependent phosphoglycerate mutase
MRLFFIRHGQSANNALNDATGSNRDRNEDPELTEVGHKQAQLLAAYIHRTDALAHSNGHLNENRRDYFGFTHLYTSLMVRSVATGTAISRANGIPLVGWTDIHEGGGIFLEDPESGEARGLPGKARSYFVENYNHLVLPEDVLEDGWWNRPFEDDLARAERGRKVVAELLKRHAGTNDRVAMVSHGDFYNRFMRAIFGGDTSKTWFLMNNTAVSRIDFREDGTALLMYHNRTDHLPEELIT